MVELAEKYAEEKDRAEAANRPSPSSSPTSATSCARRSTPSSASRRSCSRGCSAARLAEIRGILPRHPPQRHLPARRHQRHPRHVEDRGRPLARLETSCSTHHRGVDPHRLDCRRRRRSRSSRRGRPIPCDARRPPGAQADHAQPAVQRREVHAGRRPHHGARAQCRRRVDLLVEDTGIGIPQGGAEEARPAVRAGAEPVHQEPPRLRPRARHHLPVAGELHGGAMRIRSREGVGTIVSVRLPRRSAAAAAAKAAVTPEARRWSGETVTTCHLPHHPLEARPHRRLRLLQMRVEHAKSGSSPARSEQVEQARAARPPGRTARRRRAGESGSATGRAGAPAEVGLVWPAEVRRAAACQRPRSRSTMIAGCDRARGRAAAPAR
jgi:hypothetical protein